MGTPNVKELILTGRLYAVIEADLNHLQGELKRELHRMFVCAEENAADNSTDHDVSGPQFQTVFFDTLCCLRADRGNSKAALRWLDRHGIVG